MDARRKKNEGLTENIGLPLNLLEKHEPWPAYVTYTSPMVKRLMEKSKARELECRQALEESQWAAGQSKPPSVIQLKRRKSSKSSGEVTFKNPLSEASLSIWGAYSMVTMASSVVPEPTHFHTDARDGPTANCNKIVFSRKPSMRMIPYSSLLAGKEKHSSM
ncbi:CMT1A duplicated region transcript 4 protein [Choloepus didactylus]|uniref:CMT1A duplicated region transcript 4 protein n=1 Tax=Choloepus didactylus TaxID=27675 RepID=UPI00189D7C93|nr:CMT1A duplicated region transcript 4 protein [Choloepus didactylus]